MAEPIPFNRDLDFAYGEVARLGPLLRRVIARNPSPFTLFGTGTYIVGHGRVAVIDPGPDRPEHLARLRAALEGEEVSHILVTHTHRDHSPATAALQAACGAPSYGFGPHGARPRGPAVEEGADYAFAPDHRLAEGEVVAGPGWTLEAVHTPGHSSNHLCFALREANALFSGDHVMGWSTTVISPPDGDMAAYRASLAKLLAREEAIYYPTHGAPIARPRRHVRALIRHRAARERQIRACLAEGIDAIPEMVERIHVGLAPALREAAGRSVLAHLVQMVETGRAVCEGELEADGRFAPGRRG